MKYKTHAEMMDQILTKLGKSGYDHNRIEDMIRLTNPILGELTLAQWKREIKLAVEVIDYMDNKAAKKGD